LRELVDDRVGCVVNADNAKEVANALLKEWDDTTINAARERAKSYSMEAMIHGLEELYQHVRT